MSNTASILVLLFLAVTFVQSACDKIFGWQENSNWLKKHFANTLFLKNNIPFALGTILILELVSGILSLVGGEELWNNGEKTLGYYGAVFSCITLILLLLGQRLARDYDGARTIVIYFIPALLAVFWLS